MYVYCMWALVMSICNCSTMYIIMDPDYILYIALFILAAYIIVDEIYCSFG